MRAYRSYIENMEIILGIMLPDLHVINYFARNIWERKTGQTSAFEFSIKSFDLSYCVSCSNHRGVQC
jgi:hypothetical protein